MADERLLHAQRVGASATGSGVRGLSELRRPRFSAGRKSTRPLTFDLGDDIAQLMDV